jgi:hypothetical protein
MPGFHSPRLFLVLGATLTVGQLHTTATRYKLQPKNPGKVIGLFSNELKRRRDPVRAGRIGVTL